MPIRHNRYDEHPTHARNGPICAIEPWSALAEAAGHPIHSIQHDDSSSSSISNQDKNDVVMEEKDDSNSMIDHHRKELVYSDIVMEFKEVPGERVLFPPKTFQCANSDIY